VIVTDNRSVSFFGIHGILLVDKPMGLSSNAALQRVRSLFAPLNGGARPTAGHTGSLDPLATGMLPICLGEATKISGLILAGRKAYETEIALGRRTATGDAEGKVIEESAVPALTSAAVTARLATLTGPQQQRPPMFSAVRSGGVRLYQLARRGIEIERQPRPIEIYGIDLIALRPDRLTLRVVCSKGTYIRTLAEDVARALGTVGHVVRLHRRWVEPFEGAVMHGLGELERTAALDMHALRQLVLPIEQALPGLMEVHLEWQDAGRISQGQRVPFKGRPGLAAVYGPDRRLLGIGELSEDGGLRARRLFSWAVDSTGCAPDRAVESVSGGR
jgi:tRNA pseudouridine55 synthase